MRPHIPVLRQLIAFASGLLLAGCGAIPPTNVEVVEGDRPRAGEAFVLGRVVKIEDNGDTLNYGTPRSANYILVGYRNITAVHLLMGDSLEGRIPLRDDGTFIWHLKPGEYSLIGLTHYGGEMYFTEYWPVREVFTVLPSDSAVYVGSLVLNPMPTSVACEPDSCVQRLKVLVPSCTIRATERLMKAAPKITPPGWPG